MSLEKFMTLLDGKTAGWAEESDFSTVFCDGVASFPENSSIFPLHSDGDGARLFDSQEQHTLILGCTGSGKTRRLLLPAISAAMLTPDEARRPSMFVYDVKGEMTRILQPIAVRQGYRIIILDLIDPLQSDGYDVLQLANQAYKSGDIDGAETAVASLAGIISPMPPANSKIDSFWAKSSQSAIIGVTLFLMEERNGDVTFPDVVSKILSIFSGGEVSVDCFMREARGVLASGRTSALRHLNSALSGSEKTLQNVSTSLLSDVSEFVKTRSLEQIMTKHMNPAFGSFTVKPVVVFFKTVESGASAALHSFGQLVFKQIYQRLVSQAGSGSLPRPFEFFLDEVANGQRIPELPGMLAMARSKNIRFHLAAQSLSQFTELYEHAADTVISNCALKIILRTADPCTWNTVSALAGMNIVGRRLIESHELAHLALGEALILTPSHLPFMASLCDFTELPWFRNLRS